MWKTNDHITTLGIIKVVNTENLELYDIATVERPKLYSITQDGINIMLHSQKLDSVSPIFTLIVHKYHQVKIENLHSYVVTDWFSLLH